MGSKKAAEKILFESPSVQKGEEPEIKRSDFTFEKKLGEGAFGEVWKVIHKSSKRVYAMKQVLKEKVSRMHAQFKREVYIMYNLNHPHIVKLLNHFEDDKSFYLLMEFADGGNLYHHLHRQRQFIEVEAAQYFREIVLAVEYLHLHTPAIIHRDIKPENILLDSKGRVKLTDFGWSNYESAADEAPRKTVCGTLEYLPPEMIEDRSHGTTVDIWCLGVLLYEMLVGFTPFKSQTKKSMLLNISKNKPKFPLSFPPLAKELICKMLAKDSKERLNIAQVKQDRWLTEINPIKETMIQNLDQIPLPNYHDSIPLNFYSYEVVGKAEKEKEKEQEQEKEEEEEEEECSSDDLELSSDASSTKSSDKLSAVFLENLAYKESIKVIQKELTNTQSSLARSKSTVGESDCIGKELSLALSLMENKVQAKKRELAYVLNSEKELQAHISDIDVQLSGCGPPLLVEDLALSIHQISKELFEKTLEHSVLMRKKETIYKEYSQERLALETKETELGKLHQQFFELKQSLTQVSRGGSLQSMEFSMQVDIIQSRKEHHEQFSKMLSDEDIDIAKDVKKIVLNLKNFNTIDEDGINEIICKIEEKDTERKQDLVEIKMNYENRRAVLVQGFKKKKEEISSGNKSNIQRNDKEMKDSVAAEKERIREILKKAREMEHLYRIHGNELEITQTQVAVRYI